MILDFYGIEMEDDKTGTLKLTTPENEGKKRLQQAVLV